MCVCECVCLGVWDVRRTVLSYHLGPVASTKAVRLVPLPADPSCHSLITKFFYGTILVLLTSIVLCTVNVKKNFVKL